MNRFPLQDENNNQPESSKKSKKKRPNELTPNQRSTVLRFLEKKLVGSPQNENFVQVESFLLKSN